MTLTYQEINIQKLTYQGIFFITVYKVKYWILVLRFFIIWIVILFVLELWSQDLSWAKLWQPSSCRKYFRMKQDCTIFARLMTGKYITNNNSTKCIIISWYYWLDYNFINQSGSLNLNQPIINNSPFQQNQIGSL